MIYRVNRTYTERHRTHTKYAVHLIAPCIDLTIFIYAQYLAIPYKEPSGEKNLTPNVVSFDSN